MDPRLLTLRSAVDRLRRDLRNYPATLADREIAERELVALDGVLATGVPDTAALGQALLLIAAAAGSVSALAAGVHQLRQAIELFGVPHQPVQRGRPATR
ncbi:MULTISPECIES: DUF5955 family protein [unclassified Streptomyces]|uniref:DUF5955 family protein n=1 Tax=Streptomyces johnsoniae TaxID=3075532 RepID=A0ABU2S0E6_9ACTN|nr:MULTISPECIES: DUF5955 family protein [unclassified Streptomyces]MDT0442156.1 DUF5955 family protein [Streptomyces sp. DSM 41886]